MASRVFAALLFALVALAGVQAHVAPGARASALAARSSPAMTVLVVNGKKVDAKAGAPLGKTLERAGFKPNYSCKKGECGSCTVSVGGSRMKACISKVPPEPKLKSLQESGLVVR